MKSSDLLVDGFGRVAQTVHRALDGLDPDALTYRINDETNTIAWLAWHLTRIQDDHLAGAFGAEQPPSSNANTPASDPARSHQFMSPRARPAWA